MPRACSALLLDDAGIRYMRLRVGETLLGLKLRLLAAAWHKWRFGKHLHRSEGEDDEEGGGQAEVIGKGGVLLLTACSHRTVRPPPPSQPASQPA